MFIIFGGFFSLIILMGYALYWAVIIAAYAVFWCAFIMVFLGMGAVGILAALAVGGIQWYRTRSLQGLKGGMAKGWGAVIASSARRKVSSASAPPLKGPRDWTPSR